MNKEIHSQRLLPHQMGGGADPLTAVVLKCLRRAGADLQGRARDSFYISTASFTTARCRLHLDFRPPTT